MECIDHDVSAVHHAMDVIRDAKAGISMIRVLVHGADVEFSEVPQELAQAEVFVLGRREFVGT